MVILPNNSTVIDKEFASLEDLTLFPIFQTRADYLQYFGEEPPPYDPTKDRKHWFDPKAEEKANGNPYVVYDHAILRNNKGKYFIGPIILPVEVAMSVNIGEGTANEPGTGRSIPFPIRKLHEDEELTEGFGGTPLIVNKKFREKQAQQLDVFTAEDRKMLKSIYLMLLSMQK
ncbi:MAG: hypothetical protein ACUVQP_00015 [Bacteroidales bacterium]